ncbi:MAG: hypothetical protein R3F07_04125 [Opitutaceae bacterium]
MLELVSQPEYVHVLTNPVVTHLLPVAAVLLVASLFLRGRILLVTSLLLVTVASLSVWPVVRFGQQAHEEVDALADSTGRDWLEVHMQRAELWAPLFYATAGISLLALSVGAKWPNLAKRIAFAPAVLAIVASGVAGYIAYPAGKIRHEEFRTTEPPREELHENEHTH